MSIEIVYETHSISEDNERGIATGWLPGKLSDRGRILAAALGERRSQDNISAVFTSDLNRAVETANIAFGATDIPILADWRLRECDYGDLNGMPRETHLRERANYLDVPYPNGESWQQAIHRVGRVLDDLPLRWNGKRVLIIGHIATRWALQQRLSGTNLQTLASEDFYWQEGWEYHLP